jgi:hypothetical protein
MLGEAHAPSEEAVDLPQPLLDPREQDPGRNCRVLPAQAVDRANEGLDGALVKVRGGRVRRKLEGL